MNPNYFFRHLPAIITAVFAFTAAFSSFAVDYNCDRCGVETNISINSSIDEIREELKTMQIPVFDFSLKDGEFPTFDVVFAPDGLLGKSIVNNEYVEGRLKITLKDDLIYDSGEYEAKQSGIRLRNRGNTSSAQDYIIRKSYKLKLSKKADLLFRDSNDKNLKDKDWVLIGNGSAHLRWAIGPEFGRLCNLDWEPEGRHVCVIINDQYMGTYYLSESVNISKGRVDLADTGFIIENDAYWWKPEEPYFKSDYQHELVGWTYKDPNAEDMDSTTVADINKYINDVESILYNHGDISDIIDLESFANWLLVHDIFATCDGCGSNIFLTLHHLDPDNPYDCKLKMGPVWDFDDAMYIKTDNHAIIYAFPTFWYSQLINYPEFIELYRNRWFEVRPLLRDHIAEFIDQYNLNNPDVHKARMIDRAKKLMGRNPLTCHLDNSQDILDWIDERIIQLDNLIIETEVSSPVHEFVDSDIKCVYNLQGMKMKAPAKGLNIIIDSDGKAKKVLGNF